MEILWGQILFLVVMQIGLSNCYWLTMYNVTNLGGNKFTNGVILGTAEMLSSVYAALLLNYWWPDKAATYLANPSCDIRQLELLKEYNKYFPWMNFFKIVTEFFC